MTEELKQNYQLARDLVLAAFITLNRKKQSTDRGMIGILQQYLNMHRGKHGDLMNVVSGINDPKRAERLKLTEAQQQAKRRALDILESLSESELGWVDPALIEPDDDEGGILSAVSDEELALRVANANAIPATNVLGIPLSGVVEMTPEQAQQMDAAQAEQQSKAKPGRKKQNPIEAATLNAKKKALQNKGCNDGC
jgi:hypothetical protein